MKLLRLLRLVFSPFRDIAKSLRKIADLYEEELGSRVPPVMLRTEVPNPRWDTEVFGDEPEKPAWRRFLAFDKPEEDPEDDQRDL